MGKRLLPYRWRFALAVVSFLLQVTVAQAQFEKVDTTGFSPTQHETLKRFRNDPSIRPRGWRLTRDRVRPIGTERGADLQLKRMVLIPSFSAPAFNGRPLDTYSANTNSSYQFSVIVGIGANVCWERVGYYGDGMSARVKKPMGIQPMLLLYQRNSSFDGVGAVSIHL